MKRYFQILSIIVGLCLPMLVKAMPLDTLSIELSQIYPLAMDWKVGDSASYNLSGGFINGTMDISVQNVANNIVTVHQIVNLGGLGKQDCTIDIDTATGEYKKMVCNGQNQQIPSDDGREILETKNDKIQVPAGSFDCTYVKIKSKKDGSISEAWASMNVPVTGLVKMIQPSQMGKLTLVLTKFSKK